MAWTPSRASAPPARALCSASSWRIASVARVGQAGARSVGARRLHGQGGALCDGLGQCLRLGKFGAGRHHLVGEPHVKCFVRLDPAAGEQELGGTTRTDEGGQRHTQGEAGVNAESDEVGLKPTGLAHDPHVTGKGEAEAGPMAAPCIAATTGSGEAKDPRCLGIEGAGAMGKGVPCGWVGGIPGAKIGTGAKGPSDACEHHGTNSRRGLVHGVGHGARNSASVSRLCGGLCTVTTATAPTVSTVTDPSSAVINGAVFASWATETSARRPATAAATLEQRGVGPGDEVVDGVALSQLGEAHTG